MLDKVKVGIITRGSRGDPFFEACSRFKNLELVACCDGYDPQDIKARGERFGIPVMTVEDLLAYPEIEIVINATHTKAHTAFAMAAIAGGKNVYNRTPFVSDPGESRRILEFAEEKGVLVGSEPDTFLGDGIQTCRKLIAAGAIGQPISATAFIVERNTDAWHIEPDFYYPYAAGALYHLGPYCLTNLVYLLGSVNRVVGSQCIRPLETGDKQEDRSVIEHIPTHVAGFLEFADGSNGTIVTSFEQGGRSHSRVEIYGTEGAIRLPDPISFDINVKLRQIGEQDWKPVQIHPGPLPQFRGLGLADMAAAIRENRPHNANGEIASHVIDIIWSIHKSAKLCKPLKIKSTYIVQGG